jgi:hypothetical protein
MNKKEILNEINKRIKNERKVIKNNKRLLKGQFKNVANKRIDESNQKIKRLTKIRSNLPEKLFTPKRETDLYGRLKKIRSKKNIDEMHEVMMGGKRKKKRKSKKSIKKTKKSIKKSVRGRKK